MQDADFPDPFGQFIQAAVPTVEAAELRLALAAEFEVDKNLSRKTAKFPQKQASL